MFSSSPLFSRLCPPPPPTGSSRAATKSRRSCRNQPWLVSGGVGVRRGGGRGFVLLEERKSRALLRGGRSDACVVEPWSDNCRRPIRIGQGHWHGAWRAPKAVWRVVQGLREAFSKAGKEERLRTRPVPGAVLRAPSS